MTNLIGGTAQGECICRNKHHVRRRILQPRTVKLLRREMGRTVREHDFAEWVICSAQRTPAHQISRVKDGVSARRPGNRKLKRADQLLQSDELKRQRISEYGDALSP